MLKDKHETLKKTGKKHTKYSFSDKYSFSEKVYAFFMNMLGNKHINEKFRPGVLPSAKSVSSDNDGFVFSCFADQKHIY
jgi:hypothetical protein